jgi:hypothetical protein
MEWYISTWGKRTLPSVCTNLEDHLIRHAGQPTHFQTGGPIRVAVIPSTFKPALSSSLPGVPSYALERGVRLWLLEPGGKACRARVESGSRFNRYPFVVRTLFSEPVTKSTSGLPGMYSLQVYLAAPKSSEKVYKHGYYRTSELASLEPPSFAAYTSSVPDN